MEFETPAFSNDAMTEQTSQSVRTSGTQEICGGHTAVCFSVLLDVHYRTIDGVVVGQRSVLVKVANTAEVSVTPFPSTTTVRAVRDSVFARRVAHTTPEAVAVGVGAILLVTAAHRYIFHDGHQRVTPLHKCSIGKACF